MASDILNNGTFVITNMKVDPGEQADAIQAQKLAQNTGFVFGRPIGWVNGYGTNGTLNTQAVNNFSNQLRYETYFYRTAGHNKLDGTYSASGTFTQGGNPDVTYTDGFSVKGDLGQYDLFQSGTSANIGAASTWGSTRQFTVDLSSYVSENTWGTIIGTFWGTSDDGGANSRTIQYAIAQPAVFRTRWG